MSFGNDHLAGIPIMAMFMPLVVVVAALLPNRTVFGNHVKAVGGNELVTHLCGIGVNALKIKVYALACLFCGIADNIALPNAGQVSRHGWLDRAKRSALSKRFFASLSIRPATPERAARNFSGGNQQKGVIAKWLATGPRILIMDEPTRGVDVGAKQEIYALISRLTKQGVSIVFISSEMLEVMGVCDRVLVMAGGRITGEFEKAAMTQEAIMHAAADMKAKHD